MLDLLVDLFEGSDRESLARIHPALMGGEYLPPFVLDETEIARISLESTTADQISVRAQRLPDGITYRIVDEYEDMSPDYVCIPTRTELPLTLGELVGLIDGGSTRWRCGALAPLLERAEWRQLSLGASQLRSCQQRVLPATRNVLRPEEMVKALGWG